MTRPEAKARRSLPAVLLAGVVVAGIAVAQSSMAFWNDSAETAGLTMTAGTAELTIEAPTASPGAMVFPGGDAAAYTGGRFHNAGDVPLSVTVSRTDADAFASQLEVMIGVGLPGGDCTPDVRIAAGGTVGIDTHVAGADYSLCASVQLPGTATEGAGATTTVALTFTGEQR